MHPSQLSGTYIYRAFWLQILANIFIEPFGFYILTVASHSSPNATKQTTNKKPRFINEYFTPSCNRKKLFQSLQCSKSCFMLLFQQPVLQVHHSRLSPSQHGQIPPSGGGSKRNWSHVTRLVLSGHTCSKCGSRDRPLYS